MRLGKRLEKIASYIESDNIIDIGCDHAYLPIFLVKNNRIKKAIAADISKGSINKAKENILSCGYEDKIITIISDGLKDIDTTGYDTINISGMGARSIVEILCEAKEKLDNINTIIISPQTEVQYCLDEIFKLGYKVSIEDFVEENNKFYPIFVLTKGEAMSFEFGSTLSDNKDYKRYVLIKQRKLAKINQNIKNNAQKHKVDEIEKRNINIMKEEINILKIKDIINYLEELSPVKYACSWDNVGLQVGSEVQEVKKVMVAVEATQDIIDNAINEKVDMLIVHHPLIFNGIKDIKENDFIGKRLYSLIKNNISLYVMHTNFDICGSMANIASSKLWLDSIEVLMPEFDDGKGLGAIGNINHINLRSLTYILKDTFDIENVKVYGDLDQFVNRVAILPGAGSCAIDKAIEKGADVLITGDVKHHDGIDALHKGLFLIDAGHYSIEKIFVEYISNYIKERFSDISIVNEVCNEKFSWL